MKLKKRKCLKNMVIKAITAAEFIFMLIGMASMDSPDMRGPIILTVQAMIWLGLFSAANPDFGEEDD